VLNSSSFQGQQFDIPELDALVLLALEADYAAAVFAVACVQHGLAVQHDSEVIVFRRDVVLVPFIRTYLDRLGLERPY
jgi:hypothetical protein